MFDHRPRRCPFGHDVGPGHAKVSWTPCGCGPALEANERGRGLGHITVTCSTCWDERRVTRFFEPPHDTRHPTARLGQAPARADPEAIPAWIEEGQAPEGRRADAAVAGRARQVRVPLLTPVHRVVCARRGRFRLHRHGDSPGPAPSPSAVSPGPGCPAGQLGLPLPRLCWARNCDGLALVPIRYHRPATPTVARGRVNAPGRGRLAAGSAHPSAVPFASMSS